jgi:hypothetical protein
MELDHNELLEEMLRKGEQAVFPTVRKSVERFVSIINHDKVQRKINAKLQEFVKNKEELQDLIRRCEGASSVYEKLQLLRKLLKRSLDVADPWPIFRKLQCVGLMGLINGENFKFLVDDDLTLNNRVEKFLDYVETDETESVDENSRRQAFEDYIKSWKSNRQRNRCDNKSIEADEREMRREYDKAQKVNKLSYETSLNELRDEFEPLRKVLLTVKKVENGAIVEVC